MHQIHKTLCKGPVEFLEMQRQIKQTKSKGNSDRRMVLLRCWLLKEVKGGGTRREEPRGESWKKGEEAEGGREERGGGRWDTGREKVISGAGGESLE